eukprot:TRINITY_DN48930_c0_g1_i1.p1 TRINITY_DN48930_c0_g1~~TRINITY_DN48930_c0_g1_i1.p1  ORF type:complete len:1180 (+),score=214.83 TRINITY_DN48930_c0_g1_i1:164-3703(+)
MPPKKKADAVPTEKDPEPGPSDEVEEETSDTVTIHVTVSSASPLPREFETKVSIAGLCREIRSAPVSASTAPSDWVFEKDRFVRQRGQQLYDDLVNKQLTVKLKDATNFKVIGVAHLNLTPLLHEDTEVSGDFPLVLTDAYRAKWNGSTDSRASPSPLPEDETPSSTVSVSVRVVDLIGPPEDRRCWTTVMLEVGGVFALPERLSRLGLGHTGDVSAHQVIYQGKFLGIPFGGGILRKAAEERPPPPEPEEGGDAAEAATDQEDDPVPAIELSPAEFQDDSERFGLSVQFPEVSKASFYRGSLFIRQFRTVLNHVGGAWLYFTPEEKPSTDPKRPNPSEVRKLATNCKGKAWIDLRALHQPGTLGTGECVATLVSDPIPQDLGKGSTLESSRAYIRLAIELSMSVVAPPPASRQVPIETLLPRRPPCPMFPSSGNAIALYTEAVERSFDEIVRATSNGGSKVGGGVHGSVDLLHQAGTYEEIKRDLRGAVVQICRERLRKDTAVVPGSVLEGDARGAFMADTFSYLKGRMVAILDELRRKQPVASEGSAEAAEVAAARAQRSTSSNSPSFKALPTALLAPPTPGSRRRASSIVSAVQAGEQETNVRRSSITTRSKSPAGLSTPEGGQSPGGLHGGRSRSVDNLTSGQAGAPLPPALAQYLAAQALMESPGALRAKEALAAVADVNWRCQRLAAEAETVGRWDRAAALVQSRLVLAEFRDEPKAWVDYAKLCARTRGRQAAAEEALRQAVELLARGPRPHTPETALEVDLMLASLLLDRGRLEEAIAVFRTWHEKDFANSTYRFFLGLALFLADESEEARLHLESAGKPREWFHGLSDEDAVAVKLKAFRSVDGPPDPLVYAKFLEKLLEFGLPSLVFTFIDQTNTLEKDSLEREPIALLDAAASAMDRDYAAAAARVEKLLTGTEASREAWRLAGDCHYHLQDYDRALQALLMALSFEPKLEDPAVHIRLGRVLLLKKRWKQARDAFLKSINHQPTAEAWSGVAYAEYRSEELSNCYEALCEASLIDGERADVWALLVLVHLRNENSETADMCFIQCLDGNPDCDELLLEVSAEYTRREVPALAEAAARKAITIKDSGSAHAALADALALDGRTKDAFSEVEIALNLLAEHPEQRKVIFDRALKWVDDEVDYALVESLQVAQRSADQQLAERAAARTAS